MSDSEARTFSREFKLKAIECSIHPVWTAFRW